MTEPCHKACQLLRFAGSEDCLFLNVHAPAIKNSSALPVMVFFYGGGFSEGSSYEMGLYDGQHLSSSRLVIVFGCNFGILRLDHKEDSGGGLRYYK